MQTYTVQAVTASTNYPLAGASVTVYATGTTTFATIYDINGNLIANPMTADVNGLAVFQVADGTYDIIAASGAYVGPTRTRVQIYDVSYLASEVATLLASQSTGVIGFTTLALLNANLNYPAQTVAIVFADSTTANDGTYIKSGASGSGSWTQISTLTLAGVNASVSSISNLINTQVTPNITQLQTVSIGVAAPVSPLSTDYSIVVETVTDPSGSVSYAKTTTGDRYLDRQDGLRRVAWADQDAGQFTAKYAFNSATGVSFANFTQPVCLILPITGQSIALGQNPLSSSGDPLVASTARYSNNALMLGYQPRTTDQSPLITLGPWNRLTTLVEYQDATGSSQGAGETACSALANGLISQINAAVGIEPYVIAFTACQGGERYFQLRRGSPAYQGLLLALRDATRLARAAGWVPVCPAINWEGCESDMVPGGGVQGTVPPSAEEVASYMIQYQRDLQADVQMITGQREPVILMIDAINPTALVASGYGPFNQPFHQALAQLRSHPYIRCTGPNYWATVNTIDYTHFNNISYNRRGQKLARAYFAELYGRGWQDLHPVSSYWTSATTFVVNFKVPTEGSTLVLDTSGTWVSTSGLPSGNYYGFRFTDNSGSPPTISSVTVSGRAATFTLSAAPTGLFKQLSYALEHNTGNDANNGNLVGARGCLRGSAGDTSLYDSTVNYDWCTNFVWNL